MTDHPYKPSSRTGLGSAKPQGDGGSEHAGSLVAGIWIVDSADPMHDFTWPVGQGYHDRGNVVGYDHQCVHAGVEVRIGTTIGLGAPDLVDDRHIQFAAFDGSETTESIYLASNARRCVVRKGQIVPTIAVEAAT